MRAATRRGRALPSIGSWRSTLRSPLAVALSPTRRSTPTRSFGAAEAEEREADRRPRRGGNREADRSRIVRTLAGSGDRARGLQPGFGLGESGALTWGTPTSQRTRLRCAARCAGQGLKAPKTEAGDRTRSDAAGAPSPGSPPWKLLSVDSPQGPPSSARPKVARCRAEPAAGARRWKTTARSTGRRPALLAFAGIRSRPCLPPTSSFRRRPSHG